MTEVVHLDFDTSMGPVLPAATYLAVCAWPGNYRKRKKLVRALLLVSAEAAGYKYPWKEHRNRVVQRIERATYRINKHGLPAAETARNKSLPPEWNIPVTFVHPDRYRIDKFEPSMLQFQSPGYRAVGQGGRVSTKRLHFLAGKDWKFTGDSSETAKGDANFRKETWVPFLPAVPYIIALQDQLMPPPDHFSDGQIPDIVMPGFVALCRNPVWLEPALKLAEQWATDILPNEAGISVDSFIRLIRAT